MAKREYRESQRSKPLGAEGLQRIREIVEQKTYAKVNEVCVDLFSASYVIALHDNLKPENQAKLLEMPVARVVDIAFKLLTQKGNLKHSAQGGV